MLVRENKYIPQEDKDFFILLRIGLWQTVTEELSPNPDWEYIYKLACEQTVQGIIADGIGLYRKEYPYLNISQVENDKFLSASAQIVRQNFKVNQMQSRLCKLFADPTKIKELFPEAASSFLTSQSPITYVIMKGQAVGRLYPKPNLRCSGDIDFYLDDENYAVAKEYLESIASQNQEEFKVQKHIGYEIDGIEVELHVGGGSRITKKIGNVFHQITLEAFQKRDFSSYSCLETDISIPPRAHDLTFCFIHILHHYFGGIGLRQLCDFVMLLTHDYSKLDIKKLQENITRLGLTKQWNVLLEFEYRYLGLSDIIKEEAKMKYKTFSCKQTLIVSWRPDTIWKECKRLGNFGRNNSNEYDPRFLQRNFKVWNYKNKRFAKTLPVLPIKAIHDYINFYLYHILWGYRKLFHVGGAKFNI